MKKIFFIIFCQLNFLLSFGQNDSSSYDKLLLDCKDSYYYQISNRGENFFGALLTETQYLLRPQNKYFIEAGKELNKNWKIISEDSVYYKLSDSIYNRINNDYLWKGNEIELLKFKSIFQFYIENFCPCFSGTKISPGDVNSFEVISKECENKLTKNILFINSLSSQLNKFSIDERKKIQPLLSRYIFQNCPAYKAQMLSVLFEEVQNNFLNYSFALVFGLQERALDFYTRKKTDSLELIFSNHQGYKKDLDLALSVVNKSYKTIMRRENLEAEPDTITVVTTYYMNSNSVSFKGQIVCKINGSKRLSPTISSIRFLSPSEIKNKAALIKEISEEVEMPPPPKMEVIKEQKN